MKLTHTVSVIVAAAAITLAGCSSGTNEAAPATDPPVMEAQEVEAEQTETATADETVKPFGETITLPDTDVDVTVKYLGRDKATDMSTEGAVDVIEFEVGIQNNGDQPIEGYDVIFEGVYVGDTGEPVEEVYDSEKGWQGPEYSKITPGRTQTVKTAYVAPEPGLVQFMMSIGLGDTVVFEGELAE